MAAYNYFPILKTTDAELRAFAELPKQVKDKILPVFELTRSRRSKKNRDGDAWKRIKCLQEYLGDRPFILDLTTEESLQNKQIVEMLEVSSDGYDSWVSFINKIVDAGLNVIPIIHYNPDELAEVRKEIGKLQDLSNCLAFRVRADDEVGQYVGEIEKVFNLSKLILILDAGYLKPDSTDPFPVALLDSVSKKSPKAVVCAASSFPSSVADFGDEEGNFPIKEVLTTEGLRNHYEIFHGDYGSIHPVRYEARWGGWVPRIDFPSGNKFYYYRYRREQGGYIKAAKKVKANEHYNKIPEFDVWGDMEIEAAAEGNPNGLSPAHWIAVRANLYMTQQYLRLLKKNPKMSL